MSTFRPQGPGQCGGSMTAAWSPPGDQVRRSPRGDTSMIHKRAGSVLVTGAALAGALALSAGSAVAATNASAAATTHKVAATWTVKPGGAITAKAGKTTLKDKKTGTVLTCTSSSGKGTAKKGSGLSGNGIASITSLGFSNCTGPL